jgi:hypothetical protein
VATPTGETAREYPGRGRTLVLQDRMLGLLAAAERLPPGQIVLFTTGGDGRRAATLEDLGQDRPAGAKVAMHHLRVASDGETIDLWFDAAGRLVRIGIPGKDIVADRLTHQ